MTDKRHEGATLPSKLLQVGGPAGRKHLLTSLTRLAARRPEARGWLKSALSENLKELMEPAVLVAFETGDPIGQVLAELIEEQGDEQIVRQLQELCDQPQFENSIPLLELGVIVTKKVLESYGLDFSSEPADRVRAYAHLLENLATRLGALGRLEEALEHAEHAVGLFRGLPPETPDVAADLGRSLTNLGLRLSALGRVEDALSASEESISLVRQSSRLQFANHVNVQILGDNNVVLIGRSRLDLTLYRGRRGAAFSSPGEAGEAAEVLSPYAMAVPLVGREREWSDLWTWLNSGLSVSIRVVTAPGGGGKTRLALELCEEAVRRGWYAGFVKTTAPLDSVAGKLPRPTLAVVDYAAARLPWLREWLADLASSPPVGGPLRILLLERNADPALGWWAETFRRGSCGDAAVRHLLDPADGPYPLPPLRQVEQRRAILEATLRSIGSDLRLPTREEHPDFDRQLATLSWGGEPLFLMMAALTGAKCGLGHVLSLNRADLAFEVAQRRELNRISQIGMSRLISESLVCHMAAYVTLCQGLTREQAEVAIVVEDEALRHDRLSDPLVIYGALYNALPGAGNAIAPILPDVVGEAAILMALGEMDLAKASEAVVRAANQAPERVAATVMRMVQDFGDYDSRPIEWLNRLTEDVIDLEGLKRLVGQLPEKTIVLREFSAKVMAALLERLRGEGEKEGIALASNNLSIYLASLGRREEALEAVQEAVFLYRDLEQFRPDVFGPDLATSLNNLSNSLSELGHSEEALVAVQEAASLYRNLAQSRPDAFGPDLATSLNNLSNRLSDLGRREEALESVQEAVALYRNLVQFRPDAFGPDLATSLSNLSNRLSDLGRLEEAFNSVQEAVDLYRELSFLRPDAYRPDFATSLNNLSNRLSALGHREEALAVVQEAVDVYRELSQARPDAFYPNLALSLNNLSNHLSALGRQEEALEAVQEALAVYRELSQSRPDAFRPDTAKSLNNLSNYLRALGRPEEALRAVEESVAVYRELAPLRPEAFRPYLAISLNNLSVHLSALGRREESLETVEEAVDVYRELSRSRPDAFRTDLATSLNNLSNRLSDLSRREEALAAVHESVAIRRELSQSRPDAFRPDLASSLHNVALRLQELGRLGEALEASEEAVRMLLPFFQALPAAFRGWMTWMTSLYQKLSVENGRQPDPELIQAIASSSERVEPSSDPGSPS